MDETQSLARRVAAARRRRFVGRSAELELFRMALAASEPPFAVLAIHGPGGVGKTTLLHQFAALAEEAGRRTVVLNGHSLEPSPAGFLGGLQAALGAGDVPPLDALARSPRCVLIVDTTEILAPLMGWLRRVLLPQLPEQTIVVLAGRETLPAEWRADPGWGELTRVIALRNLRPEESRSFLSARGVPAARQDTVLEYTGGYPLALSLLADLYSQGGQTGALDLFHNPDVVRTLVERFVRDVPRPAFRHALEASARALTLTEGLLAAVVGEQDAYDAFQWLRSLSFFEQSRFGIKPHDVAREALEADLRWRNPERFRQVHFAVRGHIIRQVTGTGGAEQVHQIQALLYLHRNNPVMRPLYDWQTLGQIYSEAPGPEDLEQILAIAFRQHGPESAAIIAHWARRQPAGLAVFRSARRAVAGYACFVDWQAVAQEDLDADPAMRAAATLPHAALRPGESAYVFRHWADAETLQDSPAMFNMAAIEYLRTVFSAGRLAWTIIIAYDGDATEAHFAYLRHERFRHAEFIVDAHRYGVFGHDYRAEPVMEWMDQMGGREIADDMAGFDAGATVTPPAALSEPEFADAVRQALRDLARPDLLARNPLLRARVVRDRAGDGPAAAALKALLRDAAATLAASPKSVKLHRALWHTYFEPAPSQERAAELLDLPFGTYRYQLAQAVERVTALLWQRELYGPET